MISVVSACRCFGNSDDYIKALAACRSGTAAYRTACRTEPAHLLYTYFVVFNVMGRDYDAAVLSSGVCGFGMGATPNAMANMQAVCEKYEPSVKAYLLVPLIGSLFADF